MRRSNFSDKIEKDIKPFEQISADLMGPITPESIGGNRFILVVVDNYIGYIWCRPIKSKDLAIGNLVEIIRQGQNLTENQLKRLITDGGKEFDNKALKEWAEDEGVKYVKTTPYTPQHNGVVERANQTLMNKVITLISDSGLDKTFWAELINTATYLINRTLLKKSGKTAYEMLTGKEASVKHLRRIGCKTHFSVVPRRGKLDMRSRRGILLVYEEYFRAYRIYES